MFDEKRTQTHGPMDDKKRERIIQAKKKYNFFVCLGSGLRVSF